MQTVRMLGEEKVDLIELPELELEGNLVVVKILASAICGSELGAYRTEGAIEHNVGHETVT